MGTRLLLLGSDLDFAVAACLLLQEADLSGDSSLALDLRIAIEPLGTILGSGRTARAATSLGLGLGFAAHLALARALGLQAVLVFGSLLTTRLLLLPLALGCSSSVSEEGLTCL